MADNSGRAYSQREGKEDMNSYDGFDLSFDDIVGEELLTAKTDSQNQEGSCKEGDVFLKCGSASHIEKNNSDYILGTLIIRVVAAKDLEPVGPSVLGQMLFHHHHQRSEGNMNRRSGRGGSANPYACVRFGTTTQRTSEVFDTVDPIWPRSEVMYMDVTHRSLLPDANLGVDPQNTTPLADESELYLPTKKPPPSQSLQAPGKSISRHNIAQSASEVSETRASECLRPLLTVAIFHASELGKKLYNPSKGTVFGDSNDKFLGMASVDLTELLTGKIRSFDEWIPLSGSTSQWASVRIAAEYEPSDLAPSTGDEVYFTDFCRNMDLYPLHVGKRYKVEECDGVNVLISTTSEEGWVSSFLVHRFMLICEKRHIGPLDLYQDELVSLTERIRHSPLVSVVSETVQRVPDDGLVSIGADAIAGGISLLTRWAQSGIGTAVGDISYAINWDGRFNPDTSSLASPGIDDHGESREYSETKDKEPQGSSADDDELKGPPLPNMPSCPITGVPMRDPVVAADGHTYERAAIARWLRTSDKSPLTGSILPHKNLVPNYMLLSSLQEAATKPSTPVIISEEEEATTEVSIEE